MNILLVEDDLELSKALANILKNNNYSFDCACDGLEAIAKLQNKEYNVIVLDVLMPRLNGFETVKRIREKGITTPVLFLSALSEIEDKCKGLNLGGDDYLAKPFSIKELLARIDALARRGNNINHDVINFNDVILDNSTYQIKYKDKSEGLALKEMNILKILFLNHNLVVESIKLYEQIWGDDNEIDLNVVWVYISYIRKKLQLIEAPIKIKVVRGLGYKLVNKND